MNSNVIEEGFQRVWQMFQESRAESHRELQRVEQLIERYAQEADRRSQEAERREQERIQEAERRSQEAERRSQEAERREQERIQEADRRSQELDRRFQETERIVQETSRKIGQLGNRLGDFVEGFIEPAVVNLFQQWGIDVHKVSQRITGKNKKLGLAIEIDLLVVNTDTCILIEVKSHLIPAVIDKHIERIAKFKLLFPEDADKQILGAVAGMVITDEAMEYANQQGFFVIGQRGDSAVILNDPHFKPKAW